MTNSSFLSNNLKLILVHRVYDLLRLLMHNNWFFSLAPLNTGIWETKSSQATVEIEFKFDTSILLFKISYVIDYERKNMMIIRQIKFDLPKPTVE